MHPDSQDTYRMFNQRGVGEKSVRGAGELGGETTFAGRVGARRYKERWIAVANKCNLQNGSCRVDQDPPRFAHLRYVPLRFVGAMLARLSSTPSHISLNNNLLLCAYYIKYRGVN